jgi:hypothetical protein
MYRHVVQRLPDGTNHPLLIDIAVLLQARVTAAIGVVTVDEAIPVVVFAIQALTTDLATPPAVRPPFAAGDMGHAVRVMTVGLAIAIVVHTIATVFRIGLVQVATLRAPLTDAIVLDAVRIIAIDKLVTIVVLSSVKGRRASVSGAGQGAKTGKIGRASRGAVRVSAGRGKERRQARSARSITHALLTTLSKQLLPVSCCRNWPRAGQHRHSKQAAATQVRIVLTGGRRVPRVKRQRALRSAAARHHHGSEDAWPNGARSLIEGTTHQQEANTSTEYDHCTSTYGHSCTVAIIRYAGVRI